MSEIKALEKLREWSRLRPMVCQDLLDIADEIEREHAQRIAELESKLEAEAQHAREGWGLAMEHHGRIAELENARAERTCRNDKDKWSGLAKYLFVCSECGWNLVDVGNDAIDISARLMKRCPMCGARVIGTEAVE